MAIAVPVIGTEIDVVSFGKPVVDTVNSHSTSILALTTPVPWIAMPMINNWKNAYPSTPGQYRKVGDMVQFRGRLTNASTVLSGDVTSSLPAGYGPKSDETIPALVFDGAKWNVAAIDCNSVNRNFVLSTPATVLVWLAFNFQYSTT